MALTGVPEEEATAWEELLFTLHDRDHPTVVFMECDSLPRQTELEAQLQQDLPEYQHHRIDLTPYPVTSLLRALAERLPHEVQQAPRVRYVVHVHGLENSLIVTEDGELKHSLLTAQLNLERELLFRNVPYIIVVWSDAVFFRKLQREAPDLWDWVTVKHRFGDLAVRPMVDAGLLDRVMNEAASEPNQGRIWQLKKDTKKINDEIRKARTKDTPRLLKRKANTLALLATEYAKANRRKEAESINLELIGLQTQLGASNELIGLGWLAVGSLRATQHRYDDALQAFERGKTYLEGALEADRLLLISHTYGWKGEWEPAIENARLALTAHKKASNNQKVAKAFRSLGTTYAVLEQNHLALEVYYEALIWHQEVGYTDDLVKICQLVAEVYDSLRRYYDALYWYQQALALLPASAQDERKEIEERVAHLQATLPSGQAGLTEPQ